MKHRGKDDLRQWIIDNRPTKFEPKVMWDDCEVTYYHEDAPSHAVRLSNSVTIYIADEGEPRMVGFCVDTVATGT